MSANVDFLQEIDNPNQLVFKLVKPLHIEDEAGSDVAFFEIEMVSGDAEAREADRARDAVSPRPRTSRRSAIRPMTAASPNRI